MASTIISWGLTICLVGAAIYVYRPDLLNKLTAQAQEVKVAAAETSSKSLNKKPKAKKAAVPKLEAVEKADSASDGSHTKKRKISAPADKAATTKVTDEKPQEPSRADAGSLSDKDFAKQLAQAQSGTKLQVPQKQQQSKKDRRATKNVASNSPDPSDFSTEASSTAGRDADDDLTPAESPQPQPIDKSTSRAGDVSDMLEAPAAKPTTLRLTDIPTETKTKKPANKPFEQVLSKKKRNEQQRKEELRLAREESDRVHEAKKQEQLRRARMAAGTSNQTKANNFATKTNAWQSGASSTVKDAPPAGAEPLLDTFETTKSTAGPAHGAVHTESTELSSANELKSRTGENAAAAMTASAAREGPSATAQRELAGNLSEEDQIKILKEQEQDDAWESVTSKKSKKKGKQDIDSASGASSPVRPAPVPKKPQVNGGKISTAPKKAETTNRFESIQDKKIDSGLQDAEWEA